MNKIELTHSTIVLREDGILELHTSNDHVYSIEDTKENVAAFGQLTNHQKVPVLILGGSFSSLTPETRKFMATEESLLYSKAEAFLLKSLAQKILINFYIKFDKPLVPTRVFTKEDEAIKWLKGFLE
jgi:hypothetical protein